MDAKHLDLVQPAEQTLPESRILVSLFPNSCFVMFSLNDRRFNNEQYKYSRTRPPVGAEKTMLDYIQDALLSLDEVHAGRNQLNVKVTEGIAYAEYVPLVLVAIRQWGKASDPSYDPAVFVEDNRWEMAPVQIDEFHETPGVRMRPGVANIGVAYQVWRPQ